MHNPFAEKNIFQLPVLGQGIFTFSNNEYCYPSSEHQEFSIIKFLNSSFDDGLEFIFNQNTIHHQMMNCILIKNKLQSIIK